MSELGTVIDEDEDEEDEIQEFTDYVDSKVDS